MSYPLTKKLQAQYSLKNISVLILQNFEDSGLPESYLDDIAYELDSSKKEMWHEEIVLGWAALNLDQEHKVKLAKRLGLSLEDLEVMRKVFVAAWNCTTGPTHE